MPPLAPNLSQAATLRTISGWNNSSMSRRSNTMRGLLSTRTPQSSDTTSGGMLNPPLPPSIIAEAMPRGATGSFTPRVVLRRPSGGGVLPLSTWAGFNDWVGSAAAGGSDPGTSSAVTATDADDATTDDNRKVDFAFGGLLFSIGYQNDVLVGWQNGPSAGDLSTITNPAPKRLEMSAFGNPGVTLGVFTRP